jgi:murein DD-endopeptidase MepM/ murein hydrolase activator NlpD
LSIPGKISIFASEIEKKWDKFMKRIYLTVLLLAIAAVSWSLELRAPMDDYWISSGSGYRNDPMGGKEESQLHRGLDLVGPHRAPVKAAADGVVAEHWPAPNGYFKGHPIYGGLVVIDHLDGTLTLYGHLSTTYVRGGDPVKAGEIIGRQGNTGVSTGEHLHFEVIVNPLMYLSNGPNTGLDNTER